MNLCDSLELRSPCKVANSSSGQMKVLEEKTLILYLRVFIKFELQSSGLMLSGPGVRTEDATMVTELGPANS